MLPHHDRNRRVIRRPSQRQSQRVKVAGAYVSAGQVRAELDRVSSRFDSLKRDISRMPEAGGDFGRDFGTLYQGWRRFYSDAYDDWLAWGTNVDQAQNFDSELDAFRARYRRLSGREPTSPTTSTTVPRTDPTRLLAGVSDTTLGLGIAALAVLGLVVLARE